MHHDSPKICPPWTLKATLYFYLKNGGIPFYLHSNNLSQQKHLADIQITQSDRLLSIKFLSQRTLLKIQTQQKKTNKHSQETFDLTFSKMQLLINQQHQNQMLNLSLTWILITDFTFWLILYFPLVLNLEGLDPKHDTFWVHFALEKYNPSQNFTLELFKKEDIFSDEWQNRTNKKPHR